MKVGEPRPDQTAAVQELERELKNIDQSAFPALHALAENELFRLRGGIADSADIVANRQIKIRCKVDIPQAHFPNFNFVGKLLGPGGRTLKGIQESTHTKMAILGSGSLRDDSKEKELLSSGDAKYQHLKQRLHLQVDSLAPPSEAYYRLSHALAELRKVMVPSENSDFSGAPWNQQGQQMMSPRLEGPTRGGRPGYHRGGFPPTQGSSFRGRGKPWVNRGGATNGVPVVPPPQPITQEQYANNSNPAVYPTMPVYEQPEFTPGVYDDYAGTYGQDDSWGKVGLTDARGRGRSHPYARPGVQPETQ